MAPALPAGQRQGSGAWSLPSPPALTQAPAGLPRLPAGDGATWPRACAKTNPKPKPLTAGSGFPALKSRGESPREEGPRQAAGKWPQRGRGVRHKKQAGEGGRPDGGVRACLGGWGEVRGGGLLALCLPSRTTRPGRVAGGQLPFARWPA